MERHWKIGFMFCLEVWVRVLKIMYAASHIGSSKRAEPAVMSQPQVVSRHSPSNYRK